jgi:hypothetical protein
MSYQHATTRVVVSHCLYLTRYIVLSLSQAIYAYFIEGDTVFVGKRKTFDKRVRGRCFVSREALC